MNGGDPLAALHPLREPGAISWWPPAPGWWALAGLLLLLLVALGWWLWRRHRLRSYRRRALAALEHIRADYAGSGDGAACLAAANTLLKSVALRAYPRRDVAAISGDAWRTFLDDTAPGEDHFEGELLVAQYRPEPPAGDVARHLDRADRWIRRHRVSA